jgi:hypothetical protein
VPEINQVPGFRDTFFGPAGKNYIDRINRDVTRVRGINCLYYPLLDQSKRTDGIKPLADKPDLGPFDVRRHSGDPLYGEASVVRRRVDSVVREIEPAWAYGEPIAVRGVAFTPGSDEQPDERGTIYNRTLTFHLARVIADECGQNSYLNRPLRPRQGDVIQFTELLDGYFEANDVSRDESRLGGTGFFAVYSFELTQTGKFIASRKVLPGYGTPVPEDTDGS